MCYCDIEGKIMLAIRHIFRKHTIIKETIEEKEIYEIRSYKAKLQELTSRFVDMKGIVIGLHKELDNENVLISEYEKKSLVLTKRVQDGDLGHDIWRYIYE